MALLLTGLGSVLYDLQINNGEAYRRQSQYKIAETETVEAGRGQILDRNGRVLVSDKAVWIRPSWEWAPCLLSPTHSKTPESN